MAANVPAGLKAADISRFAMRAAQVETVKPVIAYWCNYWIVNQILSKNQYTADTESKRYATTLMDKLEQTKAENPGNDAITDDIAGQAYVEQFGLETFQRADNAMQANKVSKQTADTFRAAATFFDLTHIWGKPESEIAAKTKYAKFHALRIEKALKAGEDANLSNPAPQPTPTAEEPLDPNDLEVQLFDSPSKDHEQSGSRQASRQASVEEVPDEHDKTRAHLAAQSSLDESLHPSRASSLPPPIRQQSPGPAVTPPNESIGTSNPYHSTDLDNDPVSPLEPSPTLQADADGGGAGYFPEVPTFTSQEGAPALPTAPPGVPGASSEVPDLPDPSILPPPSSSAFGSSTTAGHPYPQAPPFIPPQTQYPSVPPVSGAPVDASRQPYAAPQAPPSAPYPSQYQQQPVPTNPPLFIQPRQASEAAAYVADEEAILKAQKHARWAISALNFEDVKTAVKELRGALNSLGAQ